MPANRLRKKYGMKIKNCFSILEVTEERSRSGGSGSISQWYGYAPKCHRSPTLLMTINPDRETPCKCYNKNYLNHGLLHKMITTYYIVAAVRWVNRQDYGQVFLFLLLGYGNGWNMRVESCSQILTPCMGNIVDTGTGLSYRPARLIIESVIVQYLGTLKCLARHLTDWWLLI